MQLSATLLTLGGAAVSLASLAAAETLTDAINNFPACAIPCLNSEAAGNDCGVTDFECICQNKATLYGTLQTCSASACDTDDHIKIGSALTDICSAWGDDPTQQDIASATQEVVSEVSTAGQSPATGTATSTSGMTTATTTGTTTGGGSTVVGAGSATPTDAGAPRAEAAGFALVGAVA
ncbi:hypothetical protein GGR56DRAFT_676514 [Xylariaceae sp. FL0804]|nr:hypothetical protein GGR56DRAFT_676514 [Xylariaceae sp. FL0804]